MLPYKVKGTLHSDVTKLKTLSGDILDYLGEPNVITRILKRVRETGKTTKVEMRERERKRERERFEDPTLLHFWL